MSRLDDLVIVLLIALAAAGWFGIHHYGAVEYQSGYAAAIAAGKEARDAAATANLAIESGLRTQLAAKDVAAFTQEQEHAQALETAQRRVRAGTDRLRCPASPVQPTAATDDRPTSAGPAVDRAGSAMVSDDSSVLLGLVADHQRLVRRYERVVERFEACRKVNAGP